MEFKGTKGRWKITRSKNNHAYISGSTWRRFCKVYRNTLIDSLKEEHQANVLLISKALENVGLYILDYINQKEDMKKYWIKDLTEKQVIHAPTKEIARKLCNKFHELGLKWADGDSYLNETNWSRYREENCYNYKTGKHSSKPSYISQRYEILTIDQLLDFQEYPKVMEVSHDNYEWDKRVVFMEKKGKFLAWKRSETIKEAEDITEVFDWKYAREIQPLPTLELTIDEIANKFNVSPEQIKIKK